MSDTKFYPGPWEVIGEDEGSDGVPYLEITSGECPSPQHQPVCYVQPVFIQGEDFDGDDWEITDETNATASLIAAAPDLYAACAEFVRKVDTGEARSTRSYEQMKNALARARGETS